MPMTVTGAEQITAKLYQIALLLSAGSIQSMMEEGGSKGEADAKGRARVRTGAMRDATKWQQEGPTTGTLGSSVDYAIYNELGTYKMSAQPFITPGAVTARDAIFIILANAISSLM